ncbi:MAG: hypothetical protein KKC37_02180 [Proteobacteria bacterium]|nr:hypothetical protein [Pseudomonadota bacterium]
MATASTATAPWMAVQAVLDHRGQHGLPREAGTLLPNARRPGYYPRTEHEIGVKLATGAERVGRDPRIMTPEQEVEFIRQRDFLAGKLTPLEQETRGAEEDIRARAAERALFEFRSELMLEQARVSEEESRNFERKQQLAEETWRAEQEWSQSLYEDWKRAQIGKVERANREATLLSQEELDRVNVEFQRREMKTKEELAQKRIEALGENAIEDVERFGFSELEPEEVFAAWDPWGGGQAPREVVEVQRQAEETAKSVGAPPGPATGEQPRPQTRSARYLPGEIVDIFA